MAGTTLKLRQQRSRERRHQIILAATRLFGEKGIDRTSLTEIAAAAGVPLPSIYDYFEDKMALAVAVPEDNFDILYAGTQIPLDNITDPVEKLRLIYRSTLEYITANPEWGRVFFLEIWPSVLAADPKVRESVDKYAQRYIDLIRDAIGVGRYRQDLDPYIVMSLLMGGMCQITAVWLLYGQKYDLVEKGMAILSTLDPLFLA